MSKNLKRILIAEDSPEWQKAHVSLLRSYDKKEIEFEIFPSARDALNRLQENSEKPYDLILTDLQMETEFLPDFAGEWLVKQIKDIPMYKNVPIVIISATYNIGFVAASLGTDYLSKRSLVHNPDSYFFMLDEYLK